MSGYTINFIDFIAKYSKFKVYICCLYCIFTIPVFLGHIGDTEMGILLKPDTFQFSDSIINSATQNKHLFLYHENIWQIAFIFSFDGENKSRPQFVFVAIYYEWIQKTFCFPPISFSSIYVAFLSINKLAHIPAETGITCHQCQ